jgi:hypothetical protein
LVGELAQAGATTIVAAMATEVWSQVRSRIVHLLSRGSPERSQAELEQLEESWRAVEAAPGDEHDFLAAELRGEWRGSLRRMLAESPELIDEFEALVVEIQQQLASSTTTVSRVTQEAKASDHSTVNQAGRDIIQETLPNRKPS